MVCIWDTVNFSVFDPLDREWDKILPTKARKNHMVICQSSFLSLMVRLTAPPIPRAHLKMAEFEFWFSLNARVDCNASESGNCLGFMICTCHFSSWFPLGLPSTSTQVGERKTKCQKTHTKVTKVTQGFLQTQTVKKMEHKKLHSLKLLQISLCTNSEVYKFACLAFNRCPNILLLVEVNS